jgi:hypothetical protein
MGCTRIPGSALLLGGVIAFAAVAWPGCASAAVEAASSGSDLSTVVIRGSNEATTPPSSVDDDPPVVLRGSPPSPRQPPTATYGCPAGYFYDPSSGCVLPGSAYQPYDYGYDYDYWPYWGFGGFYSGERGHRFAHGFGYRAGRAMAIHFHKPAVSGFGHGLAHIGGFGRR